MLIHRILACFIVATSLAAAADARASCLDPTECICPFGRDLNVTFAGTIVERTPFVAQFEVRLDTLALVGTSTKLGVGDILSFDIAGAPGAVINGARVIGFTQSSCPGNSTECDEAMKTEDLTLRLISGVGPTFACSGAQLATSADELAVTMASADCSSEITGQLNDAGVDTGCHDVFPCAARPGPASSTGWGFLLGIAALVGLRRARRRSVAAS